MGLAELTCPHCQAIQPIGRLEQMYTYFDLFGLDDYNVKEDNLRSRMLTLQKQYHPDKFISADAKQQKVASDISTWINTAYKQLNNIHIRYYYIVCLEKQLDYTLDMDHLANVKMEPTFLMDMMKARSTIENANADEQKDLLKEYQIMVVQTIGELQDLLEQKLYDDMLIKLAELRYYQRNVEKLEKALGPQFA
eukprot:CAMPEP_0117419680 /NCGR_PEP_ID=MMETSP0758-20121206/1190_1 /TAXON_ID=63605 /ORGANISM="Percolomonas cosmopolitus, Strain AE-1 (ATCC 50343)" /LENGTH=193 /DNA_ID=CAMNT_0005200883 /DNA_START=186 /DNA_END=763 /DNA_ORIENTATION=+